MGAYNWLKMVGYRQLDNIPFCISSLMCIGITFGTRIGYFEFCFNFSRFAEFQR